MSYIERDALGVGFCNPGVFDDKGYAKGWNAVIDIINTAPAADVRPVVSADWKEIGARQKRFACSNCKALNEKPSRFCPSCGARMVNDDVRRTDKATP